jgi:hypothetical protein
VDHNPTVTNVAPSPSTSTKTAKPGTRSAFFLEHHVGALVGAAAGAFAEALLDFERGGKLAPDIRDRGGQLLGEIFRLRKFMIVDFPSFDSLARMRGIEAMQACGVAFETADALVAEVMKILAKITHDQLH